MKPYWQQKLTLFVSLFLALQVSASTMHNIDNIEQVAYEYAFTKALENFDNPQIVMGDLDSRLRLQACESSLEAFSQSTNTGSGNQTVGVKCTAPVQWTVYVPVQIKVFQDVVVASKPLSANKVITSGDVQLKSRDIASLRQGYMSNLKDVIGQELKTPIAMGTVIKPMRIRPQKVVSRGEHVMLLALAGQMEVRMSGTALSDASIGQRVRVKNSSSKRIIEGVVEGPGIVKVSM